MTCKCGKEMEEIGTAPGGIFQRWCPRCGRMFSRSMNPSLPGEQWSEPSGLGDNAYKEYRESQGYADRVYKQHGIDLTKLKACPYCTGTYYKFIPEVRSGGRGGFETGSYLKCVKCGAKTTWEGRLYAFDPEKYNERPVPASVLDDFDPELWKKIKDEEWGPAVKELYLGFKELEKEISQLKEELTDWKDDALSAENPHSDKIHCTCVPALRKTVKDLRAKAERLENENAYISKPITQINEEMERLQEKELMLTWLNRRAAELRIFHDEEIVQIWDPMDATSIEDMIADFCERHGIDMAKEVGEEGP